MEKQRSIGLLDSAVSNGNVSNFLASLPSPFLCRSSRVLFFPSRSLHLAGKLLRHSPVKTRSSFTWFPEILITAYVKKRKTLWLFFQRGSSLSEILYCSVATFVAIPRLSLPLLFRYAFSFFSPPHQRQFFTEIF